MGSGVFYLLVLNLVMMTKLRKFDTIFNFKLYIGTYILLNLEKAGRTPRRANHFRRPATEELGGLKSNALLILVIKKR